MRFDVDLSVVVRCCRSWLLGGRGFMVLLWLVWCAGARSLWDCDGCVWFDCVLVVVCVYEYLAV